MRSRDLGADALNLLPVFSNAQKCSIQRKECRGGGSLSLVRNDFIIHKEIVINKDTKLIRLIAQQQTAMVVYLLS